MSVRCPIKDIEAVLLYLVSRKVGTIISTRIGNLEKTGEATFELTCSNEHDLAVAEVLCAYDNFDISSIFNEEEEFQ